MVVAINSGHDALVGRHVKTFPEDAKLPEFKSAEEFKEAVLSLIKEKNPKVGEMGRDEYIVDLSRVAGSWVNDIQVTLYKNPLAYRDKETCKEYSIDRYFNEYLKELSQEQTQSQSVGRKL